MPDYLLDTNIIRYWYDTDCPEYSKILARVRGVRQPDPQTQYVPRIFISVVTVGEIEYGHRVAPTPNPSEQTAFLRFVREQCPESLDITRHVGEEYGKLKAWLFERFSDKRKRTKAKRPEELVDPATSRELGVQENDIWIAAQAMADDLVLVTHDTHGHFGQLLSHFSGTLQLQVDDWAR